MVFSVAQVNKLVKNDIENDTSLKSLQVVGEISNLKYHSSGHLYFSLKDDESKINCVMFSTYASKLLFKLEDGMKVVVSCSVGVYISSGSYQLYVYNAENVGLGGLFLRFEQLKKTLEEKGLFDISHKKALPKYPTNICVISAREGAAIRDVITTIQRRWPVASITLIPSLVQGASASKDIVNNLIYADNLNFEVIILARGGGSIEDLWCFNDEEVANTIYSLKTPIVSAIGHEIDFTISDYVADYRSPTPTGAGEIVTPDINDVLDKLNSIKSRLININKSLIDQYKNKLENIKSSPYLSKIELIFADRYALLNDLEQRLLAYKNELIYNNKLLINDYKNKIINLYNDKIVKNEHILKNFEAKLDNLSPLKIMSRGYGILNKDNKVITSIEDVKENDVINTTLKDGTITSIIKDIKRR